MPYPRGLTAAVSATDPCPLSDFVSCDRQGWQSNRTIDPGRFPLASGTALGLPKRSM